MFGKLTNEEEQCIDDILTSGLNEINDVPSLALSSMSIQSMPCYGQNNDLNLSRNDKNKSLSKHSSKNTNSINDKLEGENINKSNLSVSLHLSSSINDKENITNSIKEEKENNNNFINQILNGEKSNCNNITETQKVQNINNYKNSIRFSDENILNIINSTEGASTKKSEIELSNSTQKLIDKYINIDLKNHNNDIKNIKNSYNFNSHNNIMEHADSALLSPSFVNLNNNISNIEQVQKTNTNNEEEILNGENSIIKINNLLN